MARARQGDSLGPLTVTASPAIAAKWLMPRLERFHARHPSVDLRIDASMRLVDFAREDVHVGLRYGSGNYLGLHTELLLRSEIFPVCSPALLKGKHKLRRPDDLRHHTLIHDETATLEPNGPDWAMWLRAAGVSDIDTSHGLRFNQVALGIDAAINGRGVILARDVFAAADIAAGRLVRPFAGAMPANFAIYMVTPPALLTAPKVKAFCDWLFEEARN